MKHLVLIDLDVTFDSRIGTVARYWPEALEDLLTNNYQGRMSENLAELTDKFTKNEYLDKYRKRDVETLKCSVITSFIFELENIVEQLKENILWGGGRIDDAAIILNYYPYKDLSTEELSNIVSAIEFYVGNEIPIQVGAWEPFDLDLTVLKEMQVFSYYCYDFSTWAESVLSIQKGKDKIIPYPRLTIYAPMVLKEENAFDTLTGKEKDILKQNTPFEFLKQYFAPLVGIDWYPIDVFSLVNPNILNPDVNNPRSKSSDYQMTKNLHPNQSS